MYGEIVSCWCCLVLKPCLFYPLSLTHTHSHSHSHSHSDGLFYVLLIERCNKQFISQLLSLRKSSLVNFIIKGVAWINVVLYNALSNADACNGNEPYDSMDHMCLESHHHVYRQILVGHKNIWYLVEAVRTLNWELSSLKYLVQFFFPWQNEGTTIGLFFFSKKKKKKKHNWPFLFFFFFFFFFFFVFYWKRKFKI